MDDRWCKLCQRTSFTFWQETHQALVRDGIINGESGNVPSATRLVTLGEGLGELQGIHMLCLAKEVSNSRKCVPGTAFCGTTDPTCSLVCGEDSLWGGPMDK